MLSSEKDADIAREFHELGFPVEFRSISEGQPIPVGYEGTLTGDVRMKITRVFQQHVASDVQLQFGVTEKQLATLRQKAFTEALSRSGVSLAVLAQRCEEVVREERMRDIDRTAKQKAALDLADRIKTMLILGAAGEKRDEALKHLSEVIRILRYVDGRKLHCIGPWAMRSLLHVEEGKVPLNQDTAAVLAKALGIPLQQLLVFSDDNVVDMRGYLDFPLGKDDEDPEKND